MDPSEQDTQPKPARTCQGCRTSKVRCIRPDANQSCLRCRKIGKQCLSTEVFNKRQKRHDGRSISDIEAKIAALTDSLKCRDRVASSDTARVTALESQATATVAPNAEGPTGPFFSTTYKHFTSYIEAAISEAVDDETADMVFEHFTRSMLPQFPFVAFSPETSANDIRKNDPALFLAVLDAAGDGFWNAEVSRELRKLFVQVYQNCLQTSATCSTPLLQALVISAVWHRDPKPGSTGEKLDVFQISNAAANMAIGNTSDTLREYSWSGFMPTKSSSGRGPASGYQVASLEVRRAWLGCYYICSQYVVSRYPRKHDVLTRVSTSIAQQTTNIMRWTRYMDECLEVLEIHPAGLASDKILCSQIRLQHILEEFDIQLRSSVLGSTAMEVTYRSAKRQLAEWTLSVDIWHDSLRLSHGFATLYMHEIATSSKSPVISSTEFTDCLSAAQALLDIFLSLEISLIRTLPAAYPVQLVHAAIVLVKLHLAATRLSHSEDAVQKMRSVNIDRYLARLIQKFSGWGTLWPACRLAEKFRELRDLVRQHDDGNLMASELAWLDVWTLDEPIHNADLHQATTAENQQQFFEQAQSNEVGERAMLSTSHDHDSTWSLLGADPPELTREGFPDTLPSTTLDISQLNDWFGTDLNTSTFDFDGNLQSMIQFYD